MTRRCRLARHYWALEGKPSKNRIISRRLAYHGSTITGASLGGMQGMHDQLYGAVPNIVHVMAPYAFELALPGESDHDFGIRAAKAIEDAIVEAGADNVAAFIGEPIMGAGGVKIPPESYWPEVQRICRKYDILLMLDEVITGYGRTGEWFGCQSMGIEPDMITTAKALTSGYLPLSALLVSDRVANALVEKGGEFNHGYTYSGHPGRLRRGARMPRHHRARGADRAGAERHRALFPQAADGGSLRPRHCRAGADIRAAGRDRDRQRQGDARALSRRRKGRPIWCATRRLPTA